MTNAPIGSREAAEEEYARLHPATKSNSFAVRRDPAYDDAYLRDANTSFVDRVLADDWDQRIDPMGTE